MTYYRKLAGKLCYLSPISEADAEQFAEWLNDPEVAFPLGKEAYTPVTPEGERNKMANWIKNGDPVFAIVDSQTDQGIGRCLLFNLNHVDRHATAGIFIGEKSYWSKGYGSEALRLLLDYAFNLLNLNSVMLGVFEFNGRAIECYQKVGFKEIGRRRQSRIIGGIKYDVILMDILAEEFHSELVPKILAQKKTAKRIR